MRERGRFEFVDEVTSDLSVRVTGPTREAVFSAAAEALLAATLDDPATLQDRTQASVSFVERDAELLLLRFLNELIYLRDAEGQLLRARSLEIDDANGELALRAKLVGEPIDPLRHALAGEVKATTAHGLRVIRTAEGWEATVTFDV